MKDEKKTLGEVVRKAWDEYVTRLADRPLADHAEEVRHVIGEAVAAHVRAEDAGRGGTLTATGVDDLAETVRRALVIGVGARAREAAWTALETLLSLAAAHGRTIAGLTERLSAVSAAMDAAPEDVDEAAAARRILSERNGARAALAKARDDLDKSRDETEEVDRLYDAVADVLTNAGIPEREEGREQAERVEELVAQRDEAREELAKARTENSTLLDDLGRVHETLDTAGVEESPRLTTPAARVDMLVDKLDKAESAHATLRQRDSQRQEQVARLQATIERLQAGRAETSSTPAEHPDTATLQRDAAQGREVAAIANRFGWNGVDNSKRLSVFVEDRLDNLRDLEATLRASRERETSPDVEEVARVAYDDALARREHDANGLYLGVRAALRFVLGDSGPSGGGEPVAWDVCRKCRAEPSSGLSGIGRACAEPTAPPDVAAPETPLTGRLVPGQCLGEECTKDAPTAGSHLARCPATGQVLVFDEAAPTDPETPGVHEDRAHEDKGRLLKASPILPTPEEDWRTVERVMQKLADPFPPATIGEYEDGMSAIARLRAGPQRAAEAMRERCAAVAHNAVFFVAAQAPRDEIGPYVRDAVLNTPLPE